MNSGEDMKDVLGNSKSVFQKVAEEGTEGISRLYGSYLVLQAEIQQTEEKRRIITYMLPNC